MAGPTLSQSPLSLSYACTDMGAVSHPPGLEDLKGVAHASFSQDPVWQANAHLLRVSLQLQLSSLSSERDKDELPSWGATTDTGLYGADKLALSPCIDLMHGLRTPTTASISSADSDSASTTSEGRTGAQMECVRLFCVRQLKTDRFDNENRVKIAWPVDARKLRSVDKQIVSPSFELFGIPFKLMMKPRIAKQAKGQASFKTARGRGYIELKCEADASVVLPTVSFCTSIGDGSRWQSPRGPVVHDFTSSSVSSLPHSIAEWNFSEAVDADSMTLPVCVELTLLS